MTLTEKFVALTTLVGINLGFSLFVGPLAVFSALVSFPLAVAVLYR